MGRLTGRSYDLFRTPEERSEVQRQAYTAAAASAIISRRFRTLQSRGAHVRSQDLRLPGARL